MASSLGPETGLRGGEVVARKHQVARCAAGLAHAPVATARRAAELLPRECPVHLDATAGYTRSRRRWRGWGDPLLDARATLQMARALHHRLGRELFFLFLAAALKTEHGGHKDILLHHRVGALCVFTGNKCVWLPYGTRYNSVL